MKTILLLAGAAACAFIGCGEGISPGSPVPVPAAVDADAATLTYPNGHPLALPTADPTPLSFEAEVIRLVNDHRVSIGLSALVDSEELRNAARAHSAHMILHDFFAHVNPEGDAPGDRITKNGVAWTAAGENIAGGYDSPQAVFDAWMLSPGHRANIEFDGWTHTGVGFASRVNSTYIWYWIQEFTQQK